MADSTIATRAIAAGHGVTALARKVGATKGQVAQWQVRGRIPLQHVPAVSRATGISVEELYPDFDWQYVREQVSPW